MDNYQNAETFEGIAMDGESLAPESILQAEETTVPSLEDVLSAQPEAGVPDEPTDEGQAEPQSKEKSEPGWIKGRIEQGIKRGLSQVRAELEASIRQEYEAQLMPVREALLERQADDLVSSGKITDRDTALEFLRMKQGLPMTPPTQLQEQPRNDKGQFTAKAQTDPSSPDADTQRHGEMLFAQAKAIKAAGGPDVLQAYENNPDIKQRILSREWDFADVAQALTQASAGRGMPAPIRSPNVSGATRKSIMDLSDKEFDALNDNLGRGVRVDLTK